MSNPTTTRFLITRTDTNETSAVTGPAQLRTVLQAWFATSSLAFLVLLDEFATAVHVGDPAQHALAEQLGLELRTVDPEPEPGTDGVLVSARHAANLREYIDRAAGLLDEAMAHVGADKFDELMRTRAGVLDELAGYLASTLAADGGPW